MTDMSVQDARGMVTELEEWMAAGECEVTHTAPGHCMDRWARACNELRAILQIVEAPCEYCAGRGHVDTAPPLAPEAPCPVCRASGVAREGVR